MIRDLERWEFRIFAFLDLEFLGFLNFKSLQF